MLQFINNKTILIMISIAILSLLIDGIPYRKMGHIKELKIVKIISYSYITLGVLFFIIINIWERL